MAPTVPFDHIGEDPHLRVRMSSRLTAGSIDTQLKLRRLEMEERSLTMYLETKRIEFEKRRRQQEAEDR